MRYITAYIVPSTMHAPIGVIYNVTTARKAEFAQLKLLHRENLGCCTTSPQCHLVCLWQVGERTMVDQH